MTLRTFSVLAGLMMAGTSPLLAGDGNVLKIIQASPPGSVVGNSLSSDQSLANSSLVAGPDDVLEGKLRAGTLVTSPNSAVLTGHSDIATAPSASQSGVGNSATLTIVGDGGQLQILQDNSAAAAPQGNTAVLEAFGNGALGAVLQIGDRNQATLNVGRGAVGLIGQNGDGNLGSLDVEPNAQGQLIQNGDGNTFPVSAAAGTTVTVTQNGNDLSPVGVTGMQVFSTNPGTISITQTGF